MGSTLEAPVDRSLRLRGQSLVIAGALLGALIGAGLGLVAEDAETSMRVAAPNPAGGAALAASSPGSQPPTSRGAGSGDRSDGNQSSGTERAKSADRPGTRDGKGHKDREAGRNKPGYRGKGEPGKGKDE
jgi:hypothetical protein